MHPVRVKSELSDGCPLATARKKNKSRKRRTLDETERDDDPSHPKVRQTQKLKTSVTKETWTPYEVRPFKTR